MNLKFRSFSLNELYLIVYVLLLINMNFCIPCSSGFVRAIQHVTLPEIREMRHNSEYQHSSVLLDFQKGSDTENHERLLMILDLYGVRGIAHE